MEQFPIENEELLPENANQVEVYHQEPQTYDASEKKGKQKQGNDGGGRRAEGSCVVPESESRTVLWSMSRRDGMIHETQITSDGQVLRNSRIDARALIGQQQLGGPGIHPISAAAVQASLRYPR